MRSDACRTETTADETREPREKRSPSEITSCGGGFSRACGAFCAPASADPCLIVLYPRPTPCDVRLDRPLCPESTRIWANFSLYRRARGGRKRTHLRRVADHAAQVPTRLTENRYTLNRKWQTSLSCIT